MLLYVFNSPQCDVINITSVCLKMLAVCHTALLLAMRAMVYIFQHQHYWCFVRCEINTEKSCLWMCHDIIEYFDANRWCSLMHDKLPDCEAILTSEYNNTPHQGKLDFMESRCKDINCFYYRHIFLLFISQ